MLNNHWLERVCFWISDCIESAMCIIGVLGKVGGCAIASINGIGYLLFNNRKLTKVIVAQCLFIT